MVAVLGAAGRGRFETTELEGSSMAPERTLRTGGVLLGWARRKMPSDGKKI